jgi:hypothetical protein
MPRGSFTALVVVAAVALAPAASAKPFAKSRGWSSAKAFELAKEGLEARRAGDSATCVAKDQASLALEEHPYMRLHLSACLAAMGRLVEALDAARTALAAGLREHDGELTSSAQKRVEELLPRIAHVRLLLPKYAEGDIKVTFDGIPVRPHLLRQRVAVDPGDHVVAAETNTRGERATFKESFTSQEGEDRVVEVVVKPSNLTEGERECAERATTYEAKIACFERATTKPDVRIGLEVSGYTDSLNVHVVSPAIHAAVSSPSAGWNVGGSYLVDIVTAASPDIVSMASPRYREQRHAGSLSAGQKIGVVDPQIHGNVSSEPDYLSMTGGASVSAELFDKLVTPRVGYSLTRDRIGIRNTPFSQYERNLTTHEIEGGVTFVLSPATLLVTGVTVKVERGEQSKLYRFVPMFSPQNVSLVRPGISADDVNAIREDVRAREVLPHERDRYAIGARVNHRLATSTIRAEERLYTDTWGQSATSTDGRWLVDLGEHLRVWPHLRFHYQTAASFYRLAYPVVLDRDGQPVQLYSYRTGDRELSRMMTITAGGGSRIELSPTAAKTEYAIIVSGDVMWSKFFESLYVTSRTAVYGTVGFEVEL